MGGARSTNKIAVRNEVPNYLLAPTQPALETSIT